MLKSKITKIAQPTMDSSAIDDVTEYTKAQSPALTVICEALRKEIDSCLPNATSKRWHGSPVWFIGENPVVGFNVTAKNAVSLTFWNGQSFDEERLKPGGKSGKAAQILFTDLSGIDTQSVRQWLEKAGTMIWDYHKVYAEKLAAAKAVKGNA